MRITTLAAVLLFLPLAVSAAEKVAVLPVLYTIYKTDSVSEERALKVADAVAAGVERVGLEPARGDDIIAASRDLAPRGASYCDRLACAKQVAERVGAAYAIFVSVVDKDGQFEIEVIGTDAEPITASPFGTFRSMTRRVAGLVETSLREAISTDPHAGAAAEDEAFEDDLAGTDEAPAWRDAAEEPVEEAGPTETPEKTGLSPVPFIAAASVTGALAVGWVSVEVVGYNKKSDAEGDLGQLKPLQISARVLLGFAAAGLVTTVVLFFLTDFKHSEAEASRASARWRLTPAPLSNGGLLVLDRRF
jgi:hypothetical protein